MERSCPGDAQKESRPEFADMNEKGHSRHFFWSHRRSACGGPACASGARCGKPGQRAACCQTTESGHLFDVLATRRDTMKFVIPGKSRNHVFPGFWQSHSPCFHRKKRLFLEASFKHDSGFSCYSISFFQIICEILHGLHYSGRRLRLVFEDSLMSQRYPGLHE